ncbi:MAG: histidine ammonia-lyase [Chitinophagaceae bacterium]|nr:MAG: histidine ammonia-lyase [Chitinophagaceae bacterium]
MTKNIKIDNRSYKPEDLYELIAGHPIIELSDSAIESITNCRNYLDAKLEKEDSLFYGINTGFGALCDVEIDKSQNEELQENLVKSHACGVGEEVPDSVVRLMIYLKLVSLSKGNSAISLETVNKLIEIYNRGLLPVIYRQGSLGASGDLAPLAHMSLPLIGEGEVRFKGKKYDSADLMKELGIKPIKLKAKEGLALLNGTQFMLAYASNIYLKAARLAPIIDAISALSSVAYEISPDPFNHLVHSVRPYNGQIEVAKRLFKYLEYSSGKTKRTQIQDPYAFRCIPQVHGASLDIVNYCGSLFTTEMNSVTDNPLVFQDEDKILSGGNFHGQPLAMALDYLCIGLSEWGSISERRTYKLLSGKRSLPVFLTEKSGLHSGFMIPQYTAASLVSANKQLCTPSSVDSIVSSNGQEDHVSMGGNAAVKCFKVLENLENILAIELLTSVRALQYKKELILHPALQNIVDDFLSEIPFKEEDHVLYKEIHKAKDFLKKLQHENDLL